MLFILVFGTGNPYLVKSNQRIILFIRVSEYEFNVNSSGIIDPRNSHYDDV